MLIKNNPATAQLHNDWENRIRMEFPQVDFSNCRDYLSLIDYLDSTPQRFYSRAAFKQYLSFLEGVKARDPRLLANILTDAESLISISNKILTHINSKSIHDIHIPQNHNDLINFIDKDIHYNLSKLYETPLFQFAHIIAKYSWIKQKKGIDRQTSLWFQQQRQSLLKVSANCHTRGFFRQTVTTLARPVALSTLLHILARYRMSEHLLLRPNLFLQ